MYTVDDVVVEKVQKVGQSERTTISHSNLNFRVSLEKFRDRDSLSSNSILSIRDWFFTDWWFLLWRAATSYQWLVGWRGQRVLCSLLTWIRVFLSTSQIPWYFHTASSFNNSSYQPIPWYSMPEERHVRVQKGEKATHLVGNNIIISSHFLEHRPTAILFVRLCTTAVTIQ